MLAERDWLVSTVFFGSKMETFIYLCDPLCQLSKLSSEPFNTLDTKKLKIQLIYFDAFTADFDSDADIIIFPAAASLHVSLARTGAWTWPSSPPWTEPSITMYHAEKG